MRKTLYLTILMLCGCLGLATLLAAPRDTPERDGRTLALTAGAAIEAGHMAAVATDGTAWPALDSNDAGLHVVGRAENTAAPGERVLIKRGAFRWDNAGSFAAGDIGTTAWVLGSTSVTKANVATNDIPAGIIQDVDAEGVWVDTYNPTLQLTSNVAALDVSGNQTIGGTLAVTGASTLTGNTTVGGTLAVTGAATLTAAPTLVATSTPGSVTLTMPTAPDAATAGKDTPAYIQIKIGGVTHVIPAWPLD